MRRFALLSVVVLLFVFFLSGCGGGLLNHPPQILEIVVNPEPGVVDQPVQITVNAVDQDGDALVYHVAVIPPGAAPGKLGAAVTDLGTNTTGQFNYPPTVEGTHTVVASVTDKKSDEVRKEKEFNVVTPSQPSQGNIKIIQPNNGAKVAVGKAVTVKSSKTEDIVSIKYSVRKDSEEEAESNCLNDTTTWTFTPGSTGSYEICVEGYEDCCCGGEVVATDCVMVEAVSNASPEATISATDSVECCNFITITWKASDDWGLDVGTLTVYWKDYGGKDASDTVPLSFKGEKEATGTYGPFHPYDGNVDIYLKVRDIFGATDIEYDGVSVSDNSAPKLEVEADGKSTWTTDTLEASWCFNTYVTRVLKMTDCCTNNTLHYEVEYPNGYAEGTIDPQDGQPGWTRSDELNDEGTYDATVVATDNCDTSKTSTLIVHIIIDKTPPTVALNLRDHYCSESTKATYQVHDPNYVDATITLTVGDDSTSMRVSDTGSGSDTVSLPVNYFKTDKTVMSVKVEAVDCAGNSSSVEATTVIDTMFGDVDVNAPESVTSTATFKGTLTDLTGICTDVATVVKDESAGDIIATVTYGEATCNATEATFVVKIIPSEYEGYATLTVRASDCCCGGCGSCNNSTEVNYKFYVDTKAPTWTDNGAFLYINTNPGTDRKDHVVIKFHENVEWTTPIATLIYLTGDATFQAGSNAFSYYNDIETQLRIDFATDLPNNITKATVTVYKVCDKYGNCVPATQEIPIPNDHVSTITTAPGR